MASNISVKDASAATIVMKTTDNAGVHTSHVNVDAIIPGTGATNAGKAIDSVVGATDTGTAALAKRRDTPATLTPADGDYAPLHVDSMGRLQIAPAVNPTPATSGGCSMFSKISLGTSSDETNVKSTPGQLYGIHVSNKNAAARYLKVYDAAAAPTLGAGTPKKRIYVPAGGRVDLTFPVGTAFASGIGYALTTGVADSDTVRVAADDMIVEMEYA